MVKKEEKKLFEWAVSHTNPQDRPSQSTNPPTLDEELVEAILGKSEAKRMKECVEFASNPANPLPDRLSLLDELEMLVESIDNANDVDHMSLWPSIFTLLTSLESDSKVKAATLWVIGTAAQNNPTVQQVLLRHDVLEIAFSFLSSSRNENEDLEVQKKAVYVISSMAKPLNSPGYDAFISFDGINKLTQIKGEVDASIGERIDFLLNFLQECVDDK